VFADPEEGILSFEILDPIPVGLRDGALQGLQR
jgi:hypothetical protein